MVFSSAVFLFIFFPIVILLNTFIKNTKVNNGMLIVASLVFYAFGEPVYIALLILSVTVNYYIGNILAENKSKALLVLAVSINLLMLVIFKYTGFLVETINYIPGINIPVPEMTMPIGISFFTFQAISYIADVYREEKTDGDCKGRKNFAEVLLYISLFPQLIAGPIVKYNSVKAQIAERSITVDGLVKGAKRFIYGLSKKMLISNAMAIVADGIFAMSTSEIGVGLAWFGAVCYTLQIFFDFSGYSDMAIGLGKMMGFDFPENFNYPYSASGIRDFWRRWHMSLTAWFREYLYIPLGGNRRGKARQLFNTLVVFICTGIWHGANLTFLMWGLFHGALMIIETLLAKKKKTGFNFFRWIYTMFFVIIGFVIFRADSIGYAFAYIGQMFAGGNMGLTVLVSYLTPVFLFTMLFALLCTTPIFKIAGERIVPLQKVGYVLSIVLLLLCIMNLAAGSYNPFIYFRF